MLLARVAEHADIDTRRALGFPPRKLPKVEFDPRPMRPIEYRYYMNQKKLWYFEMSGYHHFYFEVITGVELVNPQIPSFRYTDDSHTRLVIFTENQSELMEQKIQDPWEFQTAGTPVWISSK